MKIGLLHNLYGELSRGGAENVVRLMAKELKAAGHSVFLITTKPANLKNAQQKNIDHDLKIYYFVSNFYNLGHKRQLYRFFWQIANIFSIAQYFRLKKILKIEKPDLVITHNLMGLGLLAPLALRRLKIKHEHFLHDIQLLHPSGLMILGQEKKIQNFGARIYQALTRLLLSSPAKIISPSRWLLDLHQRHGFFPYSMGEIQPLQLSYSDAPADRRSRDKMSLINFLFVGQIEDHKGILFLIEAFKKIKNQAIVLRIAGDGQKLAAAKNAAAGDKRIEFLGRLDRTDVQKEMARSDYLVVPSLCYENSPTVIYEAQAADLPIIAADIGGIKEIIGPHDRLFIAGDQEDLKKKISAVSK